MINLRHLVQKSINLPLRAVNLQIRRSDAWPVKEEAITPPPPPPPPKEEPEIDLKPYGWLIKQNIKTVLDIGANTGQFAEHIHKIIPKAKIISFEPLADCYEELTKLGDSLGDFKAFNFALGEKKGEVPIYRSEFSPSSSLLPMGELHKAAFPHTRRGTVEKISVRSLDSLKLNLKEPVLIKIDVQGFEDHVIKGGKNTIKKAQVLIVETSFQQLYERQPLFDTIYKLLTDLGFEYRGNTFQDNDVRNGAPLQSDSIFMKKRSPKKKSS